MTLNQAKIKIVKWCKATILRKSVCPFCKEIFNSRSHPRAKKGRR